MVLTNFHGSGVAFGFGLGCGFGIGWGFGGSPIHFLGLGIGGGCGVGLGLGWGFGAGYGAHYVNSTFTFEGIEFDKPQSREQIKESLKLAKADPQHQLAFMKKT